MKTLMTIFGQPLTLYGALTALALLVFWCVAALYLKKRKVTGGKTLAFAVCTAVTGWLLARVVFVACNAAYYIDELDGLWTPALYFRDGGYAMTGLILGLAAGAAVAALLSGVKPALMLNAAGLAAPAGITVLRLAEFFCDTPASGDVGEGKYLEGIEWLDGLLTRLGLTMQADGDAVYPACLAGAAAALVIFIALLVWQLASRKEPAGADVLTVFLLLYGAGQLVLEQLRDDGHLVFHFVHLQQIVALVFMLAALLVWTLRFRRAGVKKRTLPVVWIVSLVCIGLAVWACFGIDRWENKLLAWLLLIVPTAIVTGAALFLRRAANYLTGEE